MKNKVQSECRNDNRRKQRKNWYMVSSVGANSDGLDPKAAQIIETARLLDLDTYRFQMQGTVFLYVRCLQSEADNLVNTLGKEEYVCAILDNQAVRVLKLGKPEMIYKSKGNNHKDQHEPKNEGKKPKTLDGELYKAITDYNDAYTILNDNGIQLFNQRERSVDLLEHIECLINSIANRPKEFDTVIAEIQIERKQFRDTCDFVKEELNAARKSAFEAGAGVAGGMAVAALAPSAAMWIATTFGTASTGTAISTLSGAVATKAALAWLGGGALAAGGGGVAAGNALLALAGPIGWGIAGVSILTSIILFRNKKMKLEKEKKEEIQSVLRNAERVKETDAQIDSLLKKTVELRRNLNNQYHDGLLYYNIDYRSIPENGQLFLGTVVNNAKALAASLSREV